MNAYTYLEQRGIIAQCTNTEELKKLFDEGSQTIYVGFDPTAKSLHVGSMMPIMALAHLQRMGHKPIAVVGGATGMIGDPSGKSEERSMLTIEKVRENADGIGKQLSHFLNFSGDNAAKLVNNYDWLGKISAIDLLRDTGKYLSVNSMIAKDSVKNRLENREEGISYTEFSYMILQAYDFLHLYEHENCKIQGGGRDQWGNITAGIELIRKRIKGEAFGLTFPLITTASGEKFGKSAGNAVWLDPELTSPYQFYQYWVNTADEDVEKFLLYFTFRSYDEIKELMQRHNEAPERREAQKALAEDVTKMLHGEEALQTAIKASEILFGKEISGISERDIQDIFKDVPSYSYSAGSLEEGVPVVDLVSELKILPSRGEVKRMIKSGGLYLNNNKIEDFDKTLTKEDLAVTNKLVIRVGRKKYHLISFE